MTSTLQLKRRQILNQKVWYRFPVSLLILNVMSLIAWVCDLGKKKTKKRSFPRRKFINSLTAQKQLNVED